MLGAADLILFLRGRVRFHYPSGRPGMAAPAPSVLVAYGAQDAEILQRSGLPGHLLRPIAAKDAA